MKTLHISIIVGIMLTSCLVLPNANAQDCFGGQSCGGRSSFSFMDGKNVAVNLKFYSNSTVSNNVHYLWLQFFDKNMNQTIPHVSFFLNATKDDKVLMHELFYSRTGSMTLQFSSGSDMGKWIVSGTAEPVLGGIMSDNDILPIEIPAFTPGTYHIHLVVLALVFANGLVDQNNPPTFDSWWSVDDKGNISQYDNSAISFGSTIPPVKIKDESPLKQFKSGIKAEDVKCGSNLHLIIKAEDGSFACVSIETGKQLALRGWATTFGTGMIVNDYTISCNTAYSRSDSGIAVLYMPTNSVGKVCVRYHNLNNVPTIVGDRIFDANNIANNASDVTTWASTNTLQGNDNATIVYSIKTGNKTGFYGLSLTCGGIPLAVGYDVNSTITASDFPWANQVFHCGVITYDYYIQGTKGIGVRYIPDSLGLP